MIAPADQELAREFGRLAWHIAQQETTDYQAGKYIEFHHCRHPAPHGSFDALLYRVSSRGGLRLRLADAYSGALYRTSLLRAKLTITLAILESSAPGYAALDAPGTGRFPPLLRLLWRVASAAYILLAAAVVFAPIHSWCRLFPAKASEASPSR